MYALCLFNLPKPVHRPNPPSPSPVVTGTRSHPSLLLPPQTRCFATLPRSHRPSPSSPSLSPLSRVSTLLFPRPSPRHPSPATPLTHRLPPSPFSSLRPPRRSPRLPRLRPRPRATLPWVDAHGRLPHRFGGRIRCLCGANRSHRLGCRRILGQRIPACARCAGKQEEGLGSAVDVEAGQVRT